MNFKFLLASYILCLTVWIVSLHANAADARDGMYRQIEKLCVKNAVVKMKKDQVAKVCRCVVEEHKAKNLDQESVKALYKIYSKSKTLKVSMAREDSNLLATYDADTAKDCLNKHKK